MWWQRLLSMLGWWFQPFFCCLCSLQCGGTTLRPHEISRDWRQLVGLENNEIFTSTFSHHLLGLFFVLIFSGPSSFLLPARSPLYSHISTTLQGLPTIRTFGNQQMALGHFHKYQNEQTQVSIYIMLFITIRFSKKMKFQLNVAHSNNIASSPHWLGLVSLSGHYPLVWNETWYTEHFVSSNSCLHLHSSCLT